jgi:phytoene dehydrogenase-like protein
MRKQYTPTSYRRAALDGRYDAIVAGSGAGGLAAAVLLAKHGRQRVLVLERHYTAGGFTHVFSRTGFEWDVGLHYIGDVQDPDSGTRRIFDHLTDGRLQWADMPDIYDRVIMPDRSFDFPTVVERFRERMCGYFPGEARAIDRYISAVNRTAA